MAFDSTSNITLSKPSISFNVNDWIFDVTLSKPIFDIAALTWISDTVLPKPIFELLIVSNYIIDIAVPNIILSVSYNPDNLYAFAGELRVPSISFLVTSPNTYSLSEVLPKPILTSSSASDIQANLNSILPLINISFNVNLGSTTIKQTWVFNTITTAHSRYTNYNFNSFFKLGSINYGINSNGSLYKLTGLKDFIGETSEANIDAEVILPASTYDEQTLKSCSDAIIYGRGDGYMEVQAVLDEQKAYTGYKVRFDNREGMHRKRVKIPKGLQGNVWQFKLKNIDGSWFDINMFEVFIRSMQRLKW